MRKLCFRGLFVLSMMLVTVVTADTASKSLQFAPQEQVWRVNHKDADVRAFIQQVADITGRSFVIDPRVKGKVTVISNIDMTSDEVYELFLNVLSVLNYATVDTGDIIKIVQQNGVKQKGIHFDENGERRGAEIVTRVISIKNASALELVPILRPMVAKYGHLAGVASANALIISDHAANIKRLQKIISKLDSAGSEEVEVVELKHAWVANVVKMLEKLLPKSVKGKSKKSSGGLTVVADETTNRIVIKGEKTARKRIKDLIAQLDTPSQAENSAQVIYLSHADAKDMAEVVKGLISTTGSSSKKGAKTSRKASVIADEGLNALVIKAEPTIMAEIKDIISQLDVRRAQVLIEAAIVEVAAEMGDQFGIQWIAADGLDKPAAVSNVTTGTQTGIAELALSVAGAKESGTVPDAKLNSGLSMVMGRVKNGQVQFGALIQALQSDNDANLLSTPSIMTLDNQEAEIIVGQNVPFISSSNSSSASSGFTTTIERKDVGITLRVTPHVNEDEVLRLQVEQNIENVSPTQVAGAADLITNKRQIKTMIVADDQETIVLGGLIRDDVTITESKIPFLGDIPYLGWMFKSQTRAATKRNLLVFLKPTILRDKQQAHHITTEKYKGIWTLEQKANEAGFETPTVDQLFEGKVLRSRE